MSGRPVMDGSPVVASLGSLNKRMGEGGGLVVRVRGQLTCPPINQYYNRAHDPSTLFVCNLLTLKLWRSTSDIPKSHVLTSSR